MDKDVIVKVKGIQGSIIEDDTIEMITTGMYYERDDKMYIKYEDVALDIDEVTSTTVKVEEDQVSVLRFGATNTQMIFARNKEHFTPYETPYGIFELIVRTTDINISKEADKITVNVAYNIDVNHTGAVESQFIIEVTNKTSR